MSLGQIGGSRFAGIINSWNVVTSRHVHDSRNTRISGRLSPQSAGAEPPQEERPGQNASSRSAQNRRFQVQLSHSRAPRRGALPYRCASLVHLQSTRLQDTTRCDTRIFRPLIILCILVLGFIASLRGPMEVFMTDFNL